MGAGAAGTLATAFSLRIGGGSFVAFSLPSAGLGLVLGFAVATSVLGLIRLAIVGLLSALRRPLLWLATGLSILRLVFIPLSALWLLASFLPTLGLLATFLASLGLLTSFLASLGLLPALLPALGLLATFLPTLGLLTSFLTSLRLLPALLPALRLVCTLLPTLGLLASFLASLRLLPTLGLLASFLASLRLVPALLPALWLLASFLVSALLALLRLLPVGRLSAPFTLVCVPIPLVPSVGSGRRWLGGRRRTRWLLRRHTGGRLRPHQLHRGEQEHQRADPRHQEPGTFCDSSWMFQHHQQGQTRRQHRPKQSQHTGGLHPPTPDQIGQPKRLPIG